MRLLLEKLRLCPFKYKIVKKLQKQCNISDITQSEEVIICFLRVKWGDYKKFLPNRYTYRDAACFDYVAHYSCCFFLSVRYNHLH